MPRYRRTEILHLDVEDAKVLTGIDRFLKKFDKGPLDKCWEWKAYRNTAGYGVINMLACGYENLLAHRMSYMYHNGDIPKGMHVLHRCDNPPCVNPDHLYIGDDARNMADAASRNRTNFGAKQHMSILSDEKVKDIRYENSIGASMSFLAKKHGVRIVTIFDVIHGKTWRRA